MEKAKMKTFNKGDMVYIPGSVRLYQLDATGIPVNYQDFEKPRNLLVLGRSEKYYEVLYEGQSWHVKKRQAYQHPGGENVSQTH